MFQIDRRILTHFDFLLLFLILPIVAVSMILVSEVSTSLFQKQLIYVPIGFLLFFIFFSIPIRKLKWLIPVFYWFSIALLISVEFFGVSRLGAQRWLEIPFINFTIQPSEILKPAFVLMLCFLISQNPPPKDGYGIKDFIKIAFHIVLPFILIMIQPDLGTALVLLIVGFGVLFLVGVNPKIWITLIVVVAVASPLLYSSLKDYQKKRITEFISEKPSYHVHQSIIAIGSGGLTGKPKEEASQAQLKFLPIATSDFIFSYHVERFGFWGALFMIMLYAFLILHILSIGQSHAKDYFLQVCANSIALLLFIYMSVNVAMTVGLAPVVGLPLPLFSYGGSSFVTFMILFGILQNLLAFRFSFSSKQTLFS